jgi:RimJ/RimL family protein N-acetyltransferase
MQTEVTIRPWAEGDLPLLERLLGDPAMTVHLGGPETPEQLRNRHKRYYQMNESDTGQMFVILAGPEKLAAGSVGYWEKEDQGQIVWETGWSVLPEFQGQGIAAKATAALIEKLREVKKHRFLHAYPSVENGASNAICRKAGFTLLGAEEFEYPPGSFMQCNDWQFDLFPDTSSS